MPQSEKSESSVVEFLSATPATSDFGIIPIGCSIRSSSRSRINDRDVKASLVGNRWDAGDILSIIRM
jgi:hypothetical protein